MRTRMPLGSAAGAAGVAVVIVLSGACTVPPPPPPPPPPTPSAVALPPLVLADRIDASLGASRWGRYDIVSDVMIVVDGRVIVERHRFGPADRRREIAEVTAAVLVALVGIVGAEGGLHDVEKPLAELLPDPPAELAGTTLHEVLLDSSMDRVGLLTAVLTHATGRPVPELARERLFAPLGIDPGWTDTAGPALTAGEMATLGALWLDRGRVGDRQVVPARWIDMTARPHAPTGRARLPYAGYGQWVARAGRHAATVVTGAGGHLIEVVPALGLVVVFTCDEDPTPLVAPPADSEVFVEMVSSLVVPALE